MGFTLHFYLLGPNVRSESRSDSGVILLGPWQTEYLDVLHPSEAHRGTLSAMGPKGVLASMDFSSKILMFFFEVACASLLRAHAAGPY